MIEVYAVKRVHLVFVFPSWSKIYKLSNVIWIPDLKRKKIWTTMYVRMSFDEIQYKMQQLIFCTTQIYRTENKIVRRNVFVCVWWWASSNSNECGTFGLQNGAKLFTFFSLLNHNKIVYSPIVFRIYNSKQNDRNDFFYLTIVDLFHFIFDWGDEECFLIEFTLLLVLVVTCVLPEVCAHKEWNFHFNTSN